MSNRELVMDVLSKLPEDTPIEDILERIAFVAGVNEALAESDQGKGIPIEEARRLLKAWTSKSS